MQSSDYRVPIATAKPEQGRIQEQFRGGALTLLLT